MTDTAAWEAVRAQLAGAGALTDVDPGVALELALETGARVTLRAAPVDVAGAPWLELVGIVGDVRYLRATQLLGSNAAGSIGAFCTVDGQLALRQLVPIDGLPARALDQAVLGLAYQVATVRARLDAGAT